MTNPRTIRTSRRRARFLEALGECAIVTRAAKAAGISRNALYEWRREDADFARDWAAAVELGIAALEDEALRRVLDGVETPVFYGGKQVATVRKFSDPLLMFMLRARRPDRYRERPNGAQPPAIDQTPELTSEERDARITQLLKETGIIPASGGPEATALAAPHRPVLPGHWPAAP